MNISFFDVVWLLLEVLGRLPSGDNAEDRRVAWLSLLWCGVLGLTALLAWVIYELMMS